MITFSFDEVKDCIEVFDLLDTSFEIKNDEIDGVIKQLHDLTVQYSAILKDAEMPESHRIDNDYWIDSEYIEALLYVYKSAKLEALILDKCADNNR